MSRSRVKQTEYDVLLGARSEIGSDAALLNIGIVRPGRIKRIGLVSAIGTNTQL